MKKNTREIPLDQQANESKMALEGLLQEGARRMLEQAIEQEVAEYVGTHEGITDGSGRRQIVRNGWKQARELQTGLGRLEIRQPRVNDRREGERFTSRILPPYMRRTPSVPCVRGHSPCSCGVQSKSANTASSVIPTA